jgi:hypothetical protein
MTITALPPAPSPTDTPAQFNTKAFAFVAALDDFVTETNATAVAVDANASDAAASANDAAAQRATAESAAATALAAGTSITGTSATSLTIGTGSKSLTIETGRAFVAGMPVRIGQAGAGANTNYMDGDVTSYDATTGALVVNATATGGSGTFSAWAVRAAPQAKGVNLDGPSAVYVNQAVNYTITDYSVFANYTVAASSGSIGISGDTVTYTAPATAGVVTLTVSKDGIPNLFTATIQPAGVATPTNASPAAGATNQGESVTLLSSAFSWVGVADTHASSDWQVATDAGFTTLVADVSADSSNLTSYTVSGLTVSTTYYWRVRHTGAANGTSAWSTATSFTTAASFNDYISTPAATPAAFGDAFEGGFYAGLIWGEVTTSSTSRTLATGTQTFTVPSMTGAPLFYGGQTVEVRSRANPANRFQGTVAGASGTTLTIDVASITGSGTFADWSVMARHRVIVAPKSSGENSGVALKNATTDFPAATRTLNEGMRATQAMRDADNATVYPAAHWARNLNIGSRTDWYIPARDELELCWRNLKPVTNNNYTTADRPTGAIYNYQSNGAFGDTANTHGTNQNSSPSGTAYTTTVPGQVAATTFRTGGAEAFEFGSSVYWSSTEYSASLAWAQYWNSSDPGRQAIDNKANTPRVRAVRRSII